MRLRTLMLLLVSVCTDLGTPELIIRKCVLGSLV